VSDLRNIVELNKLVLRKLEAYEQMNPEMMELPEYSEPLLNLKNQIKNCIHRKPVMLESHERLWALVEWWFLCDCYEACDEDLNWDKKFDEAA
tara:strand:+ start:43287 stop:43565 length:279 start_codon:yes stop_codon:yes gene_type:complete